MGGSSSGDDFDVDGDVEGNQIGDKFRKVLSHKIQTLSFFVISELNLLKYASTRYDGR